MHGQQNIKKLAKCCAEYGVRVKNKWVEYLQLLRKNIAKYLGLAAS